MQSSAWQVTFNPWHDIVYSPFFNIDIRGVEHVLVGNRLQWPAWDSGNICRKW